MRFPSAIATSGAYRPASSGTSTRGSTNHDPCALGRSALFLPALRPLRALSRPAAPQSAQDRRVERRDGLARHRRPRLRGDGAALRGAHGGAPNERLRAAPHGERATRAGPLPMSEPLDREALAALLRRPALARLLAALDGAGEEARVVGGAVRNALLGRPVRDIDVATTATPEVVTARAREVGFRPVPTGIEHGTVTVVVEGAPFEVTTLREDIETDGRRAVVRFGRDFDADARRRDFTINALSLGRDGRLHDPVGGLADLAARRMRFIGDPAARIREDYLRTLRFFRFHAEYGEGDLDRAGLEAAIREREGLGVLSPERIRAELLKLLTARRGVALVEALADAGLLTRLTGGVGEIGRLGRAASHARDGEPDALRRLAALAVTTREDAERLRERLRLSNI